MKKRMVFLFLTGLLFAGMSVFASGNKDAGSTPKKVSFTYTSIVAKDTDQVGAAIDAYMAANPNVEIEYQVIDHNTLIQKIGIMVESNTLPDMFWDNGAHFTDYLNRTKSLLDLTPYFDSSFMSTFVPGALNEVTTADGKIAAFPSESQVQGWVWNKALLESYGLKIPTTYEELKKIVPVLKKNGIATIAFGTKDPWPVWGFQHWLVLWGIWDQAEAVFKDHTLKAKDADFAKAYYAEAELYALGAFPENNATMSFDQACSLFNSGKAAVITLPSDQLGKVIGQPLENDYVFNWGINFSNSPYNQNVKVRTVGNGYGVSANVAKDPAKLKAIIDFNKWRYSSEGFPYALSVGAILPVNVDFDSSKLGAIMKQQVALIQDKNVVSVYNSDYASYRLWNTNADLWTLGWGTIRGNLEVSLMNGSMTAKDIPIELGKIDAAIDEVLGKLKTLK